MLETEKIEVLRAELIIAHEQLDKTRIYVEGLERQLNELIGVELLIEEDK